MANDKTLKMTSSDFVSNNDFNLKEAIEKVLTELEIHPITNHNWKTFNIVLNTKSSRQQSAEVKRKIREEVGKGVGGIYMVAKQKTILYIGESRRNIANRLIRHMNKIDIRTDYRSDFFKIREHQGKLTIYFFPLPSNLIESRKVIEELLTIFLEPEYKKWEMKRKVLDLRAGIHNAK
ncbi:hypothetical protein [Neobacillus sp. Marseille-QA0830]